MVTWQSHMQYFFRISSVVLFIDLPWSRQNERKLVEGAKDHLYSAEVREVMERPEELARRFLASQREERRCDFPVISLENLTWSKFKPHAGSSVLLTGLDETSWFHPDRWSQDQFLAKYGDYDIRVDIGTEGDKHTRSVRSYMELAHSSNRSFVGFGWNTDMESDLFGEARGHLPPLLTDFDFRPVVSVAARTGTAATLHGHAHTWFALLQGTKAWWISPAPAPKGVLEESERPTRNPCRWLEEEAPKELKLCVQRAGEVIYFADGQYHATCNLEDFVLGVGAQDHLPGSELQRAIYRGQVDEVKELLSTSSARSVFSQPLRPPGMPASSAYTPLHHAANLGHSAMASYLVKQSGVDLESIAGETGWRPIFYAASEGHAAVVEILASHGANVGSTAAVATSGVRPMRVAAEHGHEAVIKSLARHRAKISVADESGSQPLHFAAQYGHIAAARALVELKANVAAGNKMNFQPMRQAAAAGHASMVEFLANQGASMSASDSDGRRPMHIAAASGQRSVVEQMVELRASIAVTDHSGLQPLHFAAMKGTGYLVNFLLKQKADIEASSGNGWQPMHIAAMKGHGEVVKTLYKRRASTTAKDHSGQRPMDLASAGGFSKLAMSLKQVSEKSKVESESSSKTKDQRKTQKHNDL